MTLTHRQIRIWNRRRLELLEMLREFDKETPEMDGIVMHMHDVLQIGDLLTEQSHKELECRRR